jgi:hypothetical protein
MFTQADIDAAVTQERYRCSGILHLPAAAADLKGARNCIAQGMTVDAAATWLATFPAETRQGTASASWNAIDGSAGDAAVSASWDRAFTRTKE